MAYSTVTQHPKKYPYTSIMAGPYNGDPTGAIDCAAGIETFKADNSNVGTLHIPKGTFLIGTNLTIPVGVRLHFEAGATFSISTGVTLTINGTILATENQVIFTGAGTVVSASTTLHSSWFSTLTMAVSCMASGSTLLLSPGAYSVAVDLTIPAGSTLSIQNGALITIATTKTLTINGTLDAGSYQVFSCAGTGKVVFGAGQIVNAAWFGLNGGGATDNQAALTLALYATPANGILEIPQPTTSYALASTWVINKKAFIRGLGSVNSDGPTGIANVYGVKFNWTGGASPMISYASITGGGLENLSLDGNGTATWGIYADQLCNSMNRCLAIRNVATGCLWLGSTSGSANVGSSWNHFEHLLLAGPNLITLQDNAGHDANACHNTFMSVRGEFTGTYGIALNGSDNNRFIGIYLYRISGAGHGVHYDANVHNEYFYHLQAPVAIGGAKSVLVDAGAYAGSIFGYDMDNGQALPEITATGQLTFYCQGNGSYGDCVTQTTRLGVNTICRYPNASAAADEEWIYDNGTAIKRELAYPEQRWELSVATTKSTIADQSGYVLGAVLSPVGFSTRSEIDINHDYGGGAADWTISATEVVNGSFSVSNSSGAVNIIMPDGVRKLFLATNLTGSNATYKSAHAGSTGVTIATTKKALLYSDGVEIKTVIAAY